MTTEVNDLASAARGTLQVGVAAPRRRRLSDQAERGKWWRLLAIAVITAIMIVPIIAVFGLSLQPSQGSTAQGITFENFGHVFQQTNIVYWLENSLLISVVTVVVCVLIASPAGYVLSRGRNKLVSSYALILFVVQ